MSRVEFGRMYLAVAKIGASFLANPSCMEL
jgi:hypothetical protein